MATTHIKLATDVQTAKSMTEAASTLGATDITCTAQGQHVDEGGFLYTLTDEDVKGFNGSYAYIEQTSAEKEEAQKEEGEEKPLMTLEEIHSALEESLVAKRRRYSKHLKASVAQYVVDQRNNDAKWDDIVKELNVTYLSLSSWVKEFHGGTSTPDGVSKMKPHFNKQLQNYFGYFEVTFRL
jgi:hypothetical protein